jgi:hypothetical protein
MILELIPKLKDLFEIFLSPIASNFIEVKNLIQEVIP